MWEHLFNDKVLQKIIDEYVNEDETEDLDSMRKAIEHFSAFVEYERIVQLATEWEGLNDLLKAVISIGMVDVEESSRFMLVMDYLSDQLKVEGELL